MKHQFIRAWFIRIDVQVVDQACFADENGEHNKTTFA
jgi:hypothetical protein